MKTEGTVCDSAPEAEQGLLSGRRSAGDVGLKPVSRFLVQPSSWTTAPASYCHTSEPPPASVPSRPLTWLRRLPDVPVLNDVQSQGRREGAKLVGQQRQEPPAEVWGDDHTVRGLQASCPSPRCHPPSTQRHLSKRPQARLPGQLRSPQSTSSA